MISTGLEADFDICKRDKTGRPQLRISGVPKLSKSQFFSYVDRRLKANSEVTGYQTPLQPKTAKISTAADQWAKYRVHDPALDRYLELDAKLYLFDYLPAESRVHPRYNILIRTGRTSSHYPRWGTITSLEVEVTDEIVETTVNIELKPGSFSLHDAYVIHGSEPNRSNDFREIYTMRTPSNLGRRNGGFPFS